MGQPAVEHKSFGNSMLRFLRNWTLPGAIFGGTALYLLFAYVPQLDAQARFFGPIFEAIFPLFMIMILFVVFCKVDFHRLRLERWHLWLCLFQLFFVAVMVLLALLFRPADRAMVVFESVLCCVISPCAAAAPVVTQKLGGRLEQMISYLFLSNFLAAVLIPTVFPMIDSAADMPFMVAFLQILRGVSLVLLLPMAMAYIVKHYFRPFHRWIVSINDLSFYTWALSLSIVSGVTVKSIVHAAAPVWLLILIALLGLLACVFQYAVGRWLGGFSQTVIESGQGLGQKNTAFAVWVALTYLNPLATVGPGCYILWQNIINSVEIWHRRKLGLEHHT